MRASAARRLPPAGSKSRNRSKQNHFLIFHSQFTMLITPSRALRLAFGAEEPLPPGTVTEADIAAAEERYILPVIGQRLYERLLAGECPSLVDDYLAAPTALYTRILIQPRLDIRTGGCGTAAPYAADARPADTEPLRARRRALLAEARTLLRRAARHLAAHRDDYPEYDPHRDILNRCTLDGDFVQSA